MAIQYFQYPKKNSRFTENNPMLSNPTRLLSMTTSPTAEGSQNKSRLLTVTQSTHPNEFRAFANYETERRKQFNDQLEIDENFAIDSKEEELKEFHQQRKTHIAIGSNGAYVVTIHPTGPFVFQGSNDKMTLSSKTLQSRKSLVEIAPPSF